MLGQGEYRLYLYDRGGTTQLGEFERVIKVEWQRIMNDVSVATLTISTPPNVPDCCYWLGDIRAWRHELVIVRNDDRIWEGPVIRPQFFPDKVIISARDVLQYVGRRVHWGRFSDKTNVVSEANRAVADAFKYDDPNILAWVDDHQTGGKDVSTAYNQADCYYLDALDDYTDKGLNYTTIGRAITLWAVGQPLGQTARLTERDFLGDLSVVEDGLSLATRVVSTGGDTWAGTYQDPVQTNWSTNPRLRNNTVGYKGNSFFILSRVSDGGGLFHGEIHANPPPKPASNATNKVTNKYNKKLNDFQRTEVILSMRDQRIRSHEGEQISARLWVTGLGAPMPTPPGEDPIRNPQGGVGLRFRRWIASTDKLDEERSYAEGTQVDLKRNVGQWVTITGTVPKDTSYTIIELYRDSSVEWMGTDDGIEFTNFAIFKPDYAGQGGRLEAFFDGDTADTATLDYRWTGSPGNSTSERKYLPWFANGKQPKIDGYYGQIEILQSVDETERPELTSASTDLLSHSHPSPIAIDVPSDVPLANDAQISMNELVAGTSVPIVLATGCRPIEALGTLSEINGVWDEGGESITVSIIAAQAWGIPADPDQ